VKIVRLFTSLGLLSVTFEAGASIEDYYAQKRFRENIQASLFTDWSMREMRNYVLVRARSMLNLRGLHDLI
jgi:hypothetical protein